MKRAAPAKTFDLKVEFSREDDGRWIADIPALPGVTVYGRTRQQALASAEALALRVTAAVPDQMTVSFAAYSIMVREGVILSASFSKQPQAPIEPSSPAR
jgi:predicted RNase H-like HicB family nuclease